MTIPEPPIDRNHRSPNVWANDPARQVQAIVWHITQGTSSLAWLCSADSGVSAHYLIDRDGTIYELVDPAADSAWANGPRCDPDLSNPLVALWEGRGINPNHRTISIEHEGMSSYGRGGSLTGAQIGATVLLTAWLCQRFGLTADRTHIIGHYQCDNCTRHDCPGFAAGEWSDWIDRVATTLAAPAPVDEAAALLAAAESVPLWARGAVLRAGVVDLRAYGGGEAERLLLYDKQYFHRLAGGSYTFFRDPANPASYAALHAAGKITLYGDGPDIAQ